MIHVEKNGELIVLLSDEFASGRQCYGGTRKSSICSFTGEFALSGCMSYIDSAKLFIWCGEEIVLEIKTTYLASAVIVNPSSYSFTGYFFAGVEV